MGTTHFTLPTYLTLLYLTIPYLTSGRRDDPAVWGPFDPALKVGCLTNLQ